VFDSNVEYLTSDPGNVSIVVDGIPHVGTGFQLSPAGNVIEVEFATLAVDVDSNDTWSWPTMAVDVTAAGKTLIGVTNATFDDQQDTANPATILYVAWDAGNSQVRVGFTRGIDGIAEPYDPATVDTGDGPVAADFVSPTDIAGSIAFVWSAVPNPGPGNPWSWPSLPTSVLFTTGGTCPTTSGLLGDDWNP
jgi:hypothetical protein